ncbi:MAG: AMP-binding protein [Thermoanaerobaculia bacterium]
MFTADLLGERARITPDRTALVVVETGERLTYRELDLRARRAAALLRTRLAVPRGGRVALLAHNSLPFVELFFAAPKADVVFVPLSARATAHEIEGILRDCDPSVLFYESDFAGIVEGSRGALAPGARVVALGQPVDDGDLSWSTLLAEAGDASLPGERLDPERLHCLLYTSGTTGKPKGVMLPHRMIAFNAYSTAMNWGLREDEVAQVFTPMYHAGGLNVFMTPLFATGGTIILHRKFDAAEVLATAEKERCTVMFAVPTIYKALAEHQAFATTDLSTLRWVVSGGAPLPTYLIDIYRERGIVMRQGFGMTEVGVNCFTMTNEDAERKCGSVGTPMMYTEMRLSDTEGRDVPSGEVGELLIRGPHVSRGYWQNEPATRATFDSDGWIHTGDLARRDEDGFYYIAGRRKEMFISGGVNVYPAEIEGELVLHPSVSDAAVIGVDDPTWGEVGVAFVVAASGETIDPPALESYLALRIAKYKIPKRIIALDALPRTPYGKVVKDELRRLL